MASHSNDGEFGFQIAPMLDVLFVLLLFFMVLAMMQPREAQLHSTLPATGPGPIYPMTVIRDIAADGEVSFNGVPVDQGTGANLPQTIARLKAVLDSSPNDPVIIRPDPSTRQQRVVDVLNACKAAAAQNVAFAPAQ
jgi:biopolymer transport protein ExbD